MRGVFQPDRGVDDPGIDEREDGKESPRAIALEPRCESRGIGSVCFGKKHEERTEPRENAKEMGDHGVDGVEVVGRVAGVPKEPEGDDTQGKQGGQPPCSAQVPREGADPRG